jgi:pyrrolidone-carboxylate peptidase
MGDITPDVPLEGPFGAQHDHREIKALVTGYAPFHARYPVNSSWSIASTLPEYLPATATCPRIKLIVPPEPIEVAYVAVTEWEPKWLGSDDYDLIFHIGLAAGRKFFTMERQSMREPYWEKKDVRGEVFSRERTAELWPASEFPGILKPTFDCEDVWRRWRSNVNYKLDVRPSDDPGNYLCGFIYYSSMAWYWRKESKERPVMFLHVPDLPTKEQVQGGREVAVGLIRAVVESRERKGSFDPLKGDVTGDEPISQSTASATQALVELKESSEAAEEDDLTWSYKR